MMKLVSLESGTRTCIARLPDGSCCQEAFLSSWPGERICPGCRLRFNRAKARCGTTATRLAIGYYDPVRPRHEGQEAYDG